MIYPTFIEFFNVKPQCNHSIFTANTIHLKPYSDEVYSFLLPDGFIEFEECYIVDSRGVKHNLDASINPINGKPFLYISNLMMDDWAFSTLQIISDDFGSLYSSPIRVSSIDIEKTTYIKFRDNLWQFFGGIRLNMWYWHKKPMNEITTYYQVTREQTVSVGSKRQHIHRYYVDNISIQAATALCDILTYPILYYDGIRTSCYEMPEIEDLQGSENFISFDLFVSKNYDDKDENNIDLSVYVIGNRQLNEIIGDGNNNIINSNINV